jgi:hypothetical protein
VDPIGKRPDLAHSIAPRDTDENGLVVAAGKELDLAPFDEVGEVADDVRTIRFEPVEERSREVKTRLYFGVPIERGDEGGIRPLGHILED